MRVPKPEPEPRREERSTEPEPRSPDAVVEECALFRAHLREAFDRAKARLLTDLATQVLARELLLAPVSIAAIVSDLLRSYSEETPVAVRVSPDDRERVVLDLPIEIDPSLRSGDAVLVVRDGHLESMLGRRLDMVVRAAVQA